jgi:hypothetical protein
MFHSSSPLQANPVETSASNTQLNKKLNDSKRCDITQINVITTFLLNFIKITEEFSEFLEKLTLVFLFHQKIDCFVLKRKVDVI